MVSYTASSDEFGNISWTAPAELAEVIENLDVVAQEALQVLMQHNLENMAQMMAAMSSTPYLVPDMSEILEEHVSSFMDEGLVLVALSNPAGFAAIMAKAIKDDPAGFMDFINEIMAEEAS